MKQRKDTPVRTERLCDDTLLSLSSSSGAGFVEACFASDRPSETLGSPCSSLFTQNFLARSASFPVEQPKAFPVELLLRDNTCFGNVQFFTVKAEPCRAERQHDPHHQRHRQIDDGPLRRASELNSPEEVTRRICCRR